jgi:hypothetical protein
MDYLSVPQTTPCGHVFCYLCIYKWLEQDPICPQCRKSVDSPPYPVYILANQVDQALLKYPDPASTLRIGKDLEYYKSFKEPWCDLYSSSLFFDDNMYSSSSEDDDHLQNVSGFRIIPADSDTTSDDNSDSDTSSASIEPRSVNSNAVVHTGRNSFQDRLDFSYDPILVGAQIAAGYSADMITAFNAEHAAFAAADQYPDDCSSVSNDESSHDETLVSRTFVEPQELEPPEIPPEPTQVQDEPARPRRSRRLRSDFNTRF